MKRVALGEVLEESQAQGRQSLQPLGDRLEVSQVQGRQRHRVRGQGGRRQRLRPHGLIGRGGRHVPWG